MTDFLSVLGYPPNPAPRETVRPPLTEMYGKSNASLHGQAARALDDLNGAVQQAVIEHRLGALSSVELDRIAEMAGKLEDLLRGQGQIIPAGMPASVAKGFV